jgi:hypothetical protein
VGGHKIGYSRDHQRIPRNDPATLSTGEKMNSAGKTSRILGIAFLLQFVTSFSSGSFMKPAWFVPGDIGATMLKIATNPLLFSANILFDMLTALGVIFLGAMLFLTLRHENEKMALTAMGFYFLEAALLAVSRSEAFSLLQISREYAASGQPANLLTMGNLAYASMDYVGSTLHMLVFCIGGILFYYLLDKARIVPRVLSLWGLITVPFLLVWTLLDIFGYQVPFFLYIPYVPFELVIGIWILIKGTKETPEILQSSHETM